MYLKTFFIALLAAAAMAFAASAASAQTVSGTVVHISKRSHSIVVADRKGQLKAVHTHKAIKVGRVVKLQARKLRNGTFALQRAKVLGRARKAKLHGVVSWVDRKTGAFVVSARGTSILVRRHTKARHARASDAATTPSVGDVVTVDATLDDAGDVEANDVTEEGTANDGFDIEGHLTKVDTAARTLEVTADDDDSTTATSVINVPASFDMSKYSVGQEVELHVIKNADGSLTLAQSSDNGDETGADNGASSQGDGNHGD